MSKKCWLKHTGFAQLVLDMQKRPDMTALDHSVLDGDDEKLLDWIGESGLAVIAADNDVVEAFPVAPDVDVCCSSVPPREYCIFKNGIHPEELWHSTLLAGWLRSRQRNRLLLTAPPLRLPGAVGAPVKLLLQQYKSGSDVMTTKGAHVVFHAA
ncbi:hypothetical protein [Bradyrhizobium erythrophlei]|uniref:hypothetical protein n=1 Tax=Bradyrhizobium erythrophlei TaxID=1437360 RepID=UPI000AEE677E|nr:hypothetical protein [Bradyrhizobium erythrophlei]